MSRQMNLPQISKILQEFEKESSMMDMKEEMMSDSIDDVMEDDNGENEEEVEGERILEEVLAEIGISVGQQVRHHCAARLPFSYKANESAYINAAGRCSHFSSAYRSIGSQAQDGRSYGRFFDGRFRTSRRSRRTPSSTG